MDEYITKEQVREIMAKWYPYAALREETAMHHINKEIKEIPAADVAPVVHGKWIPVTNGRGGSECNLCHAYAPSYQSGAEYNSPYCPNCGARMDVPEDEFFCAYGERKDGAE